MTENTLLAINGSPSSGSRTHAVAATAVEIAGGGRTVDLGELDAEALLGRRPDRQLTGLLDELAEAPRILLATPVYRATYSGLLKLVLDQLQPEALRGAACVLAATGAAPGHELCLDTGLRPVVASVGGWTAPTAVYAVPADFEADGNPGPALRDRLGQAVAETFDVRTR